MNKGHIIIIHVKAKDVEVQRKKDVVFVSNGKDGPYKHAIKQTTFLTDKFHIFYSGKDFYRHL